MSGECILIIEDDPEYVDFLLAEVLAPHGYRAQAATTGQEGLIAVLEELPDLVLLDLRLWDVNHADILRQLQIAGDPPVILLTTSGTEAIALQAMRQGARDVLVQPLSAEEMAQAIAHVLQRERLAKERDWLVRKLAAANEALEKSLCQKQTLHSVIKTLSSSQNMKEILRTVVQAAISMARAEEGYLLLCKADSDKFYLRAAQHRGEEHVTDFCVQVDDSIARHVVRTGEAIALSSKDEPAISVKYRRTLNNNHHRVRSLINVPLHNQQQVIGVLGVDNVMSDQNFSKDEIELLSSLAEFATTAIQNAQVHARTDHKLDKALAEAAATHHRADLILQSIPEGVLIVDQDLHITFVNPVMERITGWQENELLGRRYEEVFIPESESGRLSANQTLPGKVLSTQSPVSLAQSKILHKDGHLVSVNSTAIALATSGTTVTEVLLMMHAPMETPHTNPTDRATQEMLPLEGPQLDRLIEATLNTLHLETSMESEPCHPVTLKPIISQAVQSFHDITSGDSIRVNLAPNLPFALGIESKIELALVNLIENALALSDPLQPILISATVNADSIIVAVEGAELSNATNEYKGSPASPQPLDNGNNGNACNEDPPPWWATPQIKFLIAKKLIQAQGGQVWLENHAGVSTRFHFSLPKIKVKEIAQAFID